ncbi:urate hydroxylase PuuD [Arhodomonas aquaeolei]|uniref:urate hydroxylase PuuD n=1 Tax=Arhodomonas aquaeolei TaxID=2369 RepID=UPI00216A6E2F|nr:urate hydroxylase PuuD [Arhodomonas aquaeolei]MCS4503936.1 urate hydroxylase PuuD [Arhodomonas aquaeolei]
MEAHLMEWANLLVRWIHLIVGIAWIGASFYFNWLENNLERTGKPAGIAGNLWAVHGGGFYFVEKYAVAPPQLPETLHWFKWEAYFTWISGFTLLIIVYYLNAQTMMVNPAVAALQPWQAVAIGIATLVAAWLVYDGLCRWLGERPRLLAALITVLIVLLAWGLSTVFSGRAAYIHVGAAIGTCMVANVFFVIIPSQKELVRAMEEGRSPDPRYGKNGLLRSRHNNYLTLPVLFIMISNHFPGTYAAAWNWAILAAVSIISVAVRHYFNIRHRPGAAKQFILPASALAFAAVVAVLSPPVRSMLTGGGTGGTVGEVSFEQVHTIIDERCTTCHAPEPSFSGYASPPAGIVLETAAQIRKHRADIKRVAVDSHYMPLGNITGITDEERAALGAWIERNKE